MNWWLSFIGIISIITVGVPRPALPWPHLRPLSSHKLFPGGREIWGWSWGRVQPGDYESDQKLGSNTSDGAGWKETVEPVGELFTFWKLEAASNRETGLYMCWLLVLLNTRGDNCVKYHIQTSTNCFFISFDKPVKRSPVPIDKLERESGSQFWDREERRGDPNLFLFSSSSLSDQTQISNFTGIKALNILSCVTVKNCLENISLEFRNLQRQSSSLLSCFSNLHACEL